MLGIRARFHPGSIWATLGGSLWATVDKRLPRTARGTPRVVPQDRPSGFAPCRSNGYIEDTLDNLTEDLIHVRPIDLDPRINGGIYRTHSWAHQRERRSGHQGGLPLVDD